MFPHSRLESYFGTSKSVALCWDIPLTSSFVVCLLASYRGALIVKVFLILIFFVPSSYGIHQDESGNSSTAPSFIHRESTHCAAAPTLCCSASGTPAQTSMHNLPEALRVGHNSMPSETVLTGELEDLN